MSITFKSFKNGLKRVMTGARHPYQKEPFSVEFSPLLHEKMHLATHDVRFIVSVNVTFLALFHENWRNC